MSIRKSSKTTKTTKTTTKTQKATKSQPEEIEHAIYDIKGGFGLKGIPEREKEQVIRSLKAGNYEGALTQVNIWEDKVLPPNLQQRADIRRLGRLIEAGKSKKVKIHKSRE